MSDLHPWAPAIRTHRPLVVPEVRCRGLQLCHMLDIILLPLSSVLCPLSPHLGVAPTISVVELLHISTLLESNNQLWLLLLAASVNIFMALSLVTTQGTLARSTNTNLQCCQHRLRFLPRQLEMFRSSVQQYFPLLLFTPNSSAVLHIAIFYSQLTQ